MPKKESRLVVRLFGAPRLTLHDAPIETARRKTLALLIYLACNSNQRLTRETLAALFCDAEGFNHLIRVADHVADLLGKLRRVNHR